MQRTLEHQIRERAYEIWAANGSPDGQADEHWLAAEREVLASCSAAAPEARRRRRGKSKAAGRSNGRPS